MRRKSTDQLPLIATDKRSANAVEFWRLQHEILRAYRALIERKEELK